MMKIKTCKKIWELAAACVCAVLLLPFSPGRAAEQKGVREQSEFGIYVSGKEIGREKFSIQNSGASVASNSALTYRDPQKNGPNVKLETELVMDEHLVPRDYQLRTDAGGQKGTLRASFAGGEAHFVYNGSPARSGLLVGDRFSILDTNVFHHFVFIARLFDFSSKEKQQSMEVLIPQEMENGILKVSDAGVEPVDLRGKKKDLHHLQVDSGTVQIHLWVDDQHILYKIALPAKGIEVVRS
jgi:hypothetical protein